MPPPINETVKRQVVQQWLSGEVRSKIAIDNNIGEGTVSGIVRDFKIGLDNSEFDSVRELALQAKKQGLNLSELASNFRLNTFIKSSGAAEDRIESFIENINSSILPPEKVVELLNQLFIVSCEQSIPLNQVPGYIKEKIEEKQRIEEEIQQANDVLESKNVVIETLNEYVKLNEKLNEYNLSFKDIDKLLNVLTNIKESGFDGNKIVAKLKRIQRLQNKEDRLKNHCKVLSDQVKKCNNVLPLAQKIVGLNIDIQMLLVFESTVNQLAKQYNLPPYVAALRLFNDIKDYNKIGGLKKEVSRLSQQVFVVNGVWANQHKAMMAMLNLQSRGITEDRILQLNILLDNNGYKASSYTSTK
jgi:hypothetical protein